MDGQLSIFDIMPKEDDVDRDLETLPEDEMITLIKTHTGLPFEVDNIQIDKNTLYSCKRKGLKFSVHYSRFTIEPYSKFISCGYSYKTGGVGAPCDSLEKAIAFFVKYSK